MSSNDSPSPGSEEKESEPRLNVRRPERSEAFANGQGQRNGNDSDSKPLYRTQTKTFWKFKLRPTEDNERQDWWFASTAIPLLAATIGPLANVLSIAALVTSWRMSLGPPGGPLTTQLEGQTYPDPSWVYYPNLVSLLTGYIGNLFLLANFTARIRYIIALPVTIILWFISSGLLIGILSAIEIHAPPQRPHEVFSQGFWYGLIAATLYMISALILMVNMLGYFLGHYPQQFNLSESQRTLILQSMLFFIWLAGGAGVFSTLEHEAQTSKGKWDFADALYFCDVTILTVGFGDLYPQTDNGRGFVFPYSVGGIIMLGLMISSISNFAGELSKDKVVYRRMEKHRQHTMERAVTDPKDVPLPQSTGITPQISKPYNGHKMNKKIPDRGVFTNPKRTGTTLFRGPKRSNTEKTHLLLDEKDRFHAMRHIQGKTTKFKNWTALIVSVIAFAILWAVGAVVFWRAEKDAQGMTYFQALYFCYVSLLTIGYGDLAPQSNAGRPFFVVWSLLAVPTMTILINSMSDTIINRFKQATSKVADFTILPKYGIWRNFLDRHPWLLFYLKKWADKRAAEQGTGSEFPVGPDPEEIKTKEDEAALKTAEEIMEENENLDEHQLARKLSRAIRKTADDFKQKEEKRYTYEEWVEFTHLIRFTKPRQDEDLVDEDAALIEWDWIGEDSPMMQEQPEAEFVLDRLCESMARYVKRQAPRSDGTVEVKTSNDSDTQTSSYKDQIQTWDSAVK